MRVLMLSLHTSPLAQPGSGDAGGMNVYVKQLAVHLASLGDIVEIVTVGEGSDVDLAPGVRVRHLTLGAVVDKERLPFRLREVTDQLLAPDGYAVDVIHSHYWISGMAGLELAKAWHVPLVHSMHTMAKVKNKHRTNDQLAEPGRRAAGEELIVRHADRLIANTNAEAAELTQLYGGCADRIAVIPPGVDLEVFRPDPQPNLGSKLHIVFAGRLQRLKGPHVLLAALAELRSRRPQLQIRLSIIGSRSGPEDYDLPTLAAELGIDDVVDFLAPMPPDALARWFRAADVVAMPSSSESFGLVALEAQACGTPVLATDVGGLSQAVIDGVTGFLVPRLDGSDWASALERIHDLGPRQRAAMGAAGIRHASEHSWARTAQEISALYTTVRTKKRRHKSAELR